MDAEKDNRFSSAFKPENSLLLKILVVPWERNIITVNPHPVPTAKVFLLFLVLLAGCSPSGNNAPDKKIIAIHDAYFHGHAQLNLTSKGFKISLLDHNKKELDHTIFNHLPYQLDTADVNRDGRTDIIIGLIKTTHFDPGEKKRLFILQIDEGQLRPLWLGSKVCRQLVDFRAMSNGTVRTLEKTKEGNYAIGVYEWQGFGLTLLEYSSNEKPYDEALAIFNS